MIRALAGVHLPAFEGARDADCAVLRDLQACSATRFRRANPTRTHDESADLSRRDKCQSAINDVGRVRRVMKANGSRVDRLVRSLPYVISLGLLDRAGRRVALHEVHDENWRAVADVAPLDGQRRFVPALAARYLVLSMREGVWNSFAVYADDTVVGHVMWGRDEDGSHWIGGMLIDGVEQAKGVGRAAARTLMGWLADQDDCRMLRLSYHPDNAAAGRLYASLGFQPITAVEEDEIVVEVTAQAVIATTAG